MVRRNTFEINVTNSRGAQDLIMSIIRKNNWRDVTGSRGDLIWYGLAITDEELDLSAKKIVNRIPGMEYISRKRPLGEILKMIYRYYPEHFSIFPRTFLLPDDREELENAMQVKKKYFIVKPTCGSQGDGIYIINNPRELENTRMHNWCDVVIQEYLHPPMLLMQKKFDLRLYVLVTSVNPLCAYLNNEGLARFCTENYETPTNQNINNHFMHLTNYSLNKRSSKFVHTDELTASNDGSKQTLTSLYSQLSSAGYPVDQIQANIKILIAKTLIAVQAGLSHQFDTRLKTAKLNKVKCFHILGIDVLLTEDCQAWLLEINANPSLRVDFESEISPGVMQSIPSALDLYVKTQVVEDAVLISQMKKKQQIALDRFNSYERVLPNDYEFNECADTMMDLQKVFSKFTDIKNPFVIPSGKFRRICVKIKGVLMREMISADYDIVYLRAVKKFEIPQMDFFAFISAIEEIARKYLDGNLIENVLRLVNILKSN